MRWFASLGMVVFLIGSAGFAGELPRKVKPVLVWTGIDSKQAKVSFARCCSQQDWMANWNIHHGRDRDADNPTCPEVDFGSYMVIVIFHTSSRLCVAEVVEETDCVRVRYQPWGNQIAFFPVEGPDGNFTYKVLDQGRGEIDLEKPYTLSYAFVVLPRSSKPLILEENAQRLIGGPPLWKERVKFPAIGTK